MALDLTLRFRAWRQQHPEPSDADFLEFVSDACRDAAWQAVTENTALGLQLSDMAARIAQLQRAFETWSEQLEDRDVEDDRGVSPYWRTRR